MRITPKLVAAVGRLRTQVRLAQAASAVSARAALQYGDRGMVDVRLWEEDSNCLLALRVQFRDGGVDLAKEARRLRLLMRQMTSRPVLRLDIDRPAVIEAVVLIPHQDLFLDPGANDATPDPADALAREPDGILH